MTAPLQPSELTSRPVGQSFGAATLLERKIQIALTRITSAIEATKPIAVFGLFSGGHDSVTATTIASLHPRFTSAVHINMGIGIARTRQYVRETSALKGWPLAEYEAAKNVNGKGQPDPQIEVRHGGPDAPN